MITMRRFVRDESGMTMGLAVIMILLLSVMGAGLLTFVSKDLNTVAEENRGQRAFEVADAGIGVAKRQLTADCSDDPDACNGHYDDPIVDPLAPADDIQWSAAAGGLTMEDLDGDGDPTDNVNVTIEADGAEDYKIISTGRYGTATRKIEAVFKGVSAPAGGGDGLGHPLYYTPSDIKLSSYTTGTTTRNRIRLNKISLFSEQDIIIEDNAYNSTPSNNRTVFKADMLPGNNGATQIGGDIDELCDWDTDTPLPLIPDPARGETCYEDRTGPWNDLGRDQLGLPNGYSHHTTGQPLTQGGFGAEGLICGVPSSTYAATYSCNQANGSAADGVYGYDCTTGTVQPADCPDTDNSEPARGNQLTFVDKEEELGPGGSEEANPAGTLSYPFPRPRPIPEALYEMSRESTLCTGPAIAGKVGCSYTGVPTTAVWTNFFPSPAGTYNKVVFVDAQSSNTAVRFNPSTSVSNMYKGIIVNWCGKFEQASSFDGVILNLRGPGFTYEAPDGSIVNVAGCDTDYTKGVYKNLGAGLQCKCWVYANGGNTPDNSVTVAGMEFAAGSELWYPTNRSWSFLNSAFETEAPPTTFEMQGWRELYE